MPAKVIAKKPVAPTKSITKDKNNKKSTAATQAALKQDAHNNKHKIIQNKLKVKKVAHSRILKDANSFF